MKLQFCFCLNIKKFVSIWLFFLRFDKTNLQMQLLCPVCSGIKIYYYDVCIYNITPVTMNDDIGIDILLESANRSIV